MSTGLELLAIEKQMVHDGLSLIQETLNIKRKKMAIFLEAGLPTMLIEDQINTLATGIGGGLAHLCELTFLERQITVNGLKQRN